MYDYNTPISILAPRMHNIKAKIKTKLINLNIDKTLSIGLRQANLVLIAYASSDGSGKPAHARSLARTSAARSYKQ